MAKALRVSARFWKHSKAKAQADRRIAAQAVASMRRRYARPWPNDESGFQYEVSMEPNPNRMKWIGGLGAGFAVVCCFTPIAVTLLGAAGTGAGMARLGWVVFPALIAAVMVAAWIWSRRRHAASPGQDATPKVSQNA